MGKASRGVEIQPSAKGEKFFDRYPYQQQSQSDCYITEFGEDQQGHLRLYLKREDMASYMGVTVESTIRMLKDFEHKGLILLNGKFLKLIDFSGLEHISKGFKI